MDSSEKSLTYKITQTEDNLKTMIRDNAIEFKEEIQRIDKWLDENNAKNIDLTEKALRENNAQWEARLSNLENLISKKDEEQTNAQNIISRSAPSINQNVQKTIMRKKS